MFACLDGLRFPDAGDDSDDLMIDYDVSLPVRAQTAGVQLSHDVLLDTVSDIG
jgi:hypothetical protein